MGAYYARSRHFVLLAFRIHGKGDPGLTSWGKLLFCLWTATMVATPGEAGDSLYYHFFKDRRTVRLDTNRLAVEAAQSPLDEGLVASILQTWGVTLVSVTPVGISPWHFLEIKPKTPHDIETLVLQLTFEPAFSFVSPVLLNAHGGWMIPTREILTQLTDPPQSQDRVSTLNHRGLNFTEAPWDLISQGVIMTTDSKNGFYVLEAANEIVLQAEYQFAEPNMIFSGGPASIPDDPGFANCWGLHNTGQFGGTAGVDMNGPEAWDTSAGSPGMIIVVIDSGVQQDHPDINQISGIDLTGEGGSGGPVSAFDRHGTLVAGTITAIMNNATGTVGIAPACKSASARTFVTTNSAGEWVTKEEWTVEALDWAQSIGARVTNNSNFYGFESSAIAQKYLETRDAGMVHFASAGNRALEVLEYPAILPGVNSAAAIQNDGSLAGFSSHGPDLDFVAPGVDIYTTDRTGSDGYVIGNYGFFDGSSFASSYSAGVAALYLATHPSASSSTVEEAMRLSATDMGPPGRDDTFGWGLVNARSVIDWDPQCTQTPVPLPQADSVPKNRYISVQPASLGRISAIAITVESTLPQWQSMIGRTWWVAQPKSIIVGPGAGTEFLISSLACEPIFCEWSSVGTIHASGPEILPFTTYRVQHVYEACYSEEGAVASAPLFQTTPKWGDVVEPFNPPSLTVQPDFIDVSAVVDRFRSMPGSPDVTRADLEPQEPNQDVNFSDISSVIDAFRGLPYPFALPAPCP